MPNSRSKDSTWDSIIGVNNQVSDTAIITGLWISAVVGAAVLILFAVLQRNSLLYKYRLVANHVRVKPPKLQEHGLISLIDWAIKSISVSDADFILTAGLDALIMVKMCALGVQIFLPLCLLGFLVLIPLHWTGGASDELDAYQSRFMRLTMSNIPQGSQIFWVHVVFVYIYLGWSMFLLRLHYAQYLMIRQCYLRKGGDVNLWRALYEPKEQQEPAGMSNIFALLRSVPLIKALTPSFVPTGAVSTPAKDSDGEEEEDSSGHRPLGSVVSAAVQTPRLLSQKSGLVPSGVGSSLCSPDGTPERVTRRSEIGIGAVGPDAAPNITHRSLSQIPATSAGGAIAGEAAARGRNGRSIHRAAYSLGARTAAAGGDHQRMRYASQRENFQLHHRSSKRQAALPKHQSTKMSGQAVEPSGGRSSSRVDRDRHGGAEAGTVSGTGGSRGRRRPVAEAMENTKQVDLVDAASAADHNVNAVTSTAAAIVADNLSPVDAAPCVNNRAAQSQQPICPPRTAPPPQKSSEVSMQLYEESPDLEAGLPSGAAEEKALGGECQISPPSQLTMRLDSDAQQLAWWPERRPVWSKPSQHAWWEHLRAALRVHSRRDGGKGQNVEEKDVALLDLHLRWPSVGHRKTVNAEWDGMHVSVLAQHYAVLVTDVVERSRREGACSGKASSVPLSSHGVQDSVAEAPDMAVPYRCKASYIPLWLRWLRSWCDLRYGNQAARKLNPNLRSTLSEDIIESVPSSANRAINSNSFPSNAPGLPYPVRNTFDIRTTSTSQHRRTRSTGNGLFPPAASLELGTIGTRAGLNGDVLEIRGRSPSTPLAAASLGSGVATGSSGRTSGGEKLLKLLEMMAREAHEKFAAMGGVMTMGPGQMQRHSTIDPTAVARNSTSMRSVRTATLPPTFVTLAAEQVFQVLQPQVPGEGLPSACASTAMSPCAEDGSSSVPVTQTGEQQDSHPGENGVFMGVPVAEASELPEGCEGGGEGAAGSSAKGNHKGGDGDGGTVVGETVGDAGTGAKEFSAATDSAAPQPQHQHHGPSYAFLGPPDVVVDRGQSRDARSDALARWEVVRQAVWSGRVAQLPWRYRYSAVSATFLRLFPDEFDRAIQVINFKAVDLLLMQADKHMAKYEYAVTYEEKTGKELFGRIGFCGLAGERRRLRDYHLEQINKLLAEVRKARIEAANKAQTNAWFVFFKTQRAAAMASQCVIHGEDNRQFRVHPAPGPEEVNWSALWSNFRERDLRRNLMRPLVALMVTFPIGIFTGGVTQLDYLLCPSHVCAGLQEGSEAWINASCTYEIKKRENQQLSWGWYCEQKDPVAKMLKRLVVAWLPSLLLILWQGMVLPLFFTFVVQFSRQARSLSEADRLVAKNMFYFGIFNVFLGGVVGSTIIQGINSAIEKGPSEIFNLIGTYVPTSSNFFINYTMFRVFVSVPFRMLWPHIGIRMYLIRRYLRCSCIITNRERAFLMAPVSPRYGFEVGMVMIIYLIGFAFSLVSPLLMSMALFFFLISWLFWRWALLYVYVRKYEGGGTMWPIIFNRVMVCMAIFPVFTACVFITKHAYVQAIVLLVTVPIILIRFHKYCYYRFETGVKAMPLEATVNAPQVRVEPWVYTPPPLLSNLAGWHSDWSKCWMGWNVPVMYG